jgi:hypothetical protein
MKIVINNQYGGFNLSPEAIKLYNEKSKFRVWGYTDDYINRLDSSPDGSLKRDDDGESFITYWVKEDLGDSPTTDELNKTTWFHDRDIPRDDKLLIEVIKELGRKKASGKHCTLKIVTIPDNVDWQIEEYDGLEWVSEKHNTWS